jgi:putative ABC transport system substrate-binding protein
MRRRDFITLIGGAAAAWPRAARAQQPPTLPLIGLLHSASGQYTDSFLQGLREAGLIEHQNVQVEYRAARGDYGQLPSLAADLVALRVDLIAALGSPAARVAKTASVKPTPPIPVVFTGALDPVAEGLVQSLNRPDGNMTGVTSIGGALASKRADLMRELLRDDDAIAILINPGNPVTEAERRDADAALQAVGLGLAVLSASNPGEIDDAFAGLKSKRIGALIIAFDTFFFGQSQRLATLAAQHAVPIIGPIRESSLKGDC